MDWLIWLAAAGALLILELSTLAFVAAYFALGALAASLAAGLGAPLWFQGAEFAAVSVVLLVLTRRLVVGRAHHPAGREMNVPEIGGRAGVVTVAIDDDGSSGQIRIGGDYWTARALPGEAVPIPVGTRVEVVEVTGVTAHVRALPALASGDPASEERTATWAP